MISMHGFQEERIKRWLQIQSGLKIQTVIIIQTAPVKPELALLSRHHHRPANLAWRHV